MASSNVSAFVYAFKFIRGNVWKSWETNTFGYDKRLSINNKREASKSLWLWVLWQKESVTVFRSNNLYLLTKISDVYGNTGVYLQSFCSCPQAELSTSVGWKCLLRDSLQYGIWRCSSEGCRWKPEEGEKCGPKAGVESQCDLGHHKVDFRGSFS